MSGPKGRKEDEGVPFVDVVERGAIAIVVEVDVDERLRVLREASKDGEEDRLLPHGRIAHLEDREEDLVEEDLDLLLELGAHPAQHAPEDLATEFKDLDDGGDGVPREGEAEVLLDGVDEGRPFARRVRVDDDVGVDEHGEVVREDGEDEVERQELRAHGVRFEIAFAAGKRVVVSVLVGRRRERGRTYLSAPRGFIESLQRARKTRNASLM